MSQYAAILERARAALATGDAQAAFSELRAVLAWPGQIGPRPRFVEALTLFADIGDALGAEDLPTRARKAAEAPDDPQMLYALGYQLVEEGLDGLAATVLARANGLSPDEPRILTELVAALEGDGQSAEACRALRGSPALLESNFLCSYLLAFNALMCGDLEEPRRRVTTLLGSSEPEQQYMAAQLQGMLLRADALKGISRLDDRDLRGWHFVLNGALLLHLSPHGFDEGMRGRYAFVQDSASLCRQGLDRLKVVLDAWGLRPPRVFVLPERRSEILGLAAASVLGLPIERWPAEGSEAPGLLVAYDTFELETEAGRSEPALELFKQVRRHRKGQLLFSQASCWTRQTMVAADLTTFLYQRNASPWSAQLQVAPGGGVVQSLPATDSAEALAQKVVEATADQEEMNDLDALAALARAVRTVQGEQGPGAFRREGYRLRLRQGSPVPSSRFL